MSLESLANKYKTPVKQAPPGLTGLAGLAAKYGTPVSNKKADLGTVEGLTQKANEVGYGKQASAITGDTPKLSFLQRLGTGLDSLNPAEAILTGTEKGVVAGVGKYVTGAAQGIASAVTGTDYVGEKRHFSEVVAKLGIENTIAKAGLGFLGDVLLDPSTYFGGAIARGLTTGAKAGTRLALKGVGKVAPEVERGLTIAGTGLQDALGRAFQYGYKTTKGAKEDVLTFLSKSQRAKLGLAASNLDRLGTGILNPAQREELALKMVAGKREEFLAREAGQTVDEFKKSNTLYHGTSPEGYSGIMTEGFKRPSDLPSGLTNTSDTNAAISNAIFATPNKVFAEKFGKDIIEINKSKLNIQDGWGRFQGGSVAETKAEIKRLVDKGVDAIRLGKGMSEEIKIINPSKIEIINKIKSTDPLVQKTIEEQSARSKKFAQQLDLENPYETYFPFIKKDKLEKFLNESKGIKVGSESYRKQFKNLLTNESMELDPAKAFFTRESQVVSDKMTRNFLSGFVKRYGKPLEEFANSDDAAKAGYRLIKEKGIFGKELGYVPEFDAKLIRDSLDPGFQTVNMLAKATGFDAVTSLFKRSVTGLFAPFHIRNYVSGNIQNFEALGIQVFNPKNIAIGQKIAYNMGKGTKFGEDLINLGGKDMKFSQVMKPFEDRFSGDTFYNADFDMALKSGSELKSVAGTFTKERLKETVKTVGLGQEGIPFKVGRAIGQYIEHQQKATAYVTALGLGKSIPDALKLAEKAGFDYRALTAFESQIMRRIIPFYSFTRKNISLQLSTLGENPQRINQVLNFFQAQGEPISAEEKKQLPAFIRESIGVKLKDTPEGLKQYISSFGTPIEAFTQLFGSNPILRAISQTNPILKAPIEIGIGKDSFRQKDLKDVYDAREYKLAPQFVKDLLDIKEVQKDTLKKNAQGKLVKVGEYTQYVADPVRLLIARSLFTSRGVSYLDSVFGNDLSGLPKLLKTTTGLKPQVIDLEMQKSLTERDKKRELEDLLTKTGKVKQFTKTYVPKTK